MNIIAFLRTLWADEPALVRTTIAGLIIAAAAKLGVVLPEAGVAEAVGVVIAFLLTGVGVRKGVKPV